MPLHVKGNALGRASNVPVPLFGIPLHFSPFSAEWEFKQKCRYVLKQRKSILLQYCIDSLSLEFLKFFPVAKAANGVYAQKNFGFGCPSMTQIPLKAAWPSTTGWLKTAWQDFQPRAFFLLGAFLLTLLLAFLPLVFFGAGALAATLARPEQALLFWIIGLSIGGALSAFFGTWGNLVYFSLTLDPMLSFKESWNKTAPLIFPALGLSFLSFFFILGGLLFFVVPGLVFLIWFNFSIFLLLTRDLRWLNALKESRRLFHRLFWKITARLFLLFLVFPLMISNIPFFGNLLSFALQPFITLCWIHLWSDAQRCAGETFQEFSVFPWITVSLAGYLFGFFVFFSKSPSIVPYLFEHGKKFFPLEGIAL